MYDEINDFGERIVGAKKDVYRRRGISISDIDDISAREYLTTITKEYVWPIPDYVKLVENGMHPTCAYYVRLVREKLQPKLRPTTRFGDLAKEDAKLYIIFVNILRSSCEGLKGLDTIDTVYNSLKQHYTDESGRWANNEAYRTQGLNDEFLSAIRLTRNTLSKLDIERMIQNFPYSFRGDLKGARIAQYHGTGVYRLVSGAGRPLTQKEFDTPIEAVAYAQKELPAELDGKKKTKKVSELVHIVRPQLEYIERHGPNLRLGKDTTPEHMLKLFGLRGGQFGNWNTQDDRQAYLNYAFDAFVDLAEALDIPLQFIGLDIEEG